MLSDYANLILSSIIFLVYGATCAISISFAFSLQFFHKIEEKANLELFSSLRTNPLDTEIQTFDKWMRENNTFAGSLLIFLSLFDLISLLRIIHHF